MNRIRLNKFGVLGGFFCPDANDSAPLDCCVACRYKGDCTSGNVCWTKSHTCKKKCGSGEVPIEKIPLQQ
jgi:hypothetical protein